jgi:5'-phosphate synthase pdxT subunit
VLATVEARAVCCRQGAVIVTSFHPELSHDTRLHELFLATMATAS